jgi:hypothetical protein
MSEQKEILLRKEELRAYLRHMNRFDQAGFSSAAKESPLSGGSCFGGCLQTPVHARNAA